MKRIAGSLVVAAIRAAELIDQRYALPVLASK